MMKREVEWLKTLGIVLLVGTFAAGFFSCAATDIKPAAEETEKPAAAETPVREDSGWVIEVKGMTGNTMSQAEMAEAAGHASHYTEMELEKKGETHTYQGIPLELVIAMVDGPDTEHPFVFDRSKWDAGYDITVTAADGYSATFLSSDYASDAMIIAVVRDSEEIPPMLVGDVSGKLWVKDLVSIEADLGDADAAEVFTMKVDIAGIQKEYTIPELEASPWYTEGTGSFTTSAGTTYTNEYGGIRFEEFMNSFTILEPDTTVSLIATDGYEMTYSGAQIMDKSDGEWILAFKTDGEYMEFDPGYIRTVKIGPGNPNIEGHLSVKMIETIKATGEKFADFTLLMKGRMEMAVDRQTMQSGVSCHKKTVTYYNRKEDTDVEYTGIPLHLLLAFADDPQYAPHHQDKSILSYDADAAKAGYKIKISAGDGFSITLDSTEVHGNDDVIIAMIKDGTPLPENEQPLIIVWDKDAETVPAGIKAVRNITMIELLF